VRQHALTGVADDVAPPRFIPLIHREATAHEIQTHQLRTVALLGTRFTMKTTFRCAVGRGGH
jgi:aspartate/glutamate racemase